jgi:flagellar biosynthesis protein FlhG
VIALAEPPDTHYAVLGLHPRATREQVEKAYKFCLDMYGEGALATYSLLGAEEAQAARARIEAAYVVLSDSHRRREYDAAQGLASPAAPLLPFPVAVAPAPSTPPVSVPAPPVVSAPAPPPPRPEALPERLSGADLKRLRESRGVDLREIALVTKIGVRFLEYIEEDRLALLPAPVYLRGFLMEYGRVVGLDPRRTAEAYMSRLPRKPDQ